MMLRLSIGLLAVTACAAPSSPAPEARFFERLSTLCNGEAYAGQLVSNDAVDADFKSADMRMGPARCDGTVIYIPFAVDEDRSRTWVITRTPEGVRLKHDHRHKDGEADTLTNYGGDSNEVGTMAAQDFPADDETKALFTQENIEVSNANTWRVEIDPSAVFTYQMSRPERLFRVEFDLSQAVAAPPPSWAQAPIE